MPHAVERMTDGRFRLAQVPGASDWLRGILISVLLMAIYAAFSHPGHGWFEAIALICLAATSYVHVESDEIAVLNKIYGTTSLPGEHIIATNGEKGPQAEILTPGWHPWFLVNVIYQVENKKVISIPSGKYGFLNAKDGAPLRPDQYLADAFPPGRELDMLDAEYFLNHGGQRGPQRTA